MQLLHPKTFSPAVMHAHPMDGAVAEGSRSMFVAHLGLLSGSKSTTPEPGQGRARGHRHAIAHTGLREG